MRPTGLRTEDLLLAAWNAVGVPLVAVSVLGPVLTLGDEPDPVAGLVQMLAVLGAIVAVATRPTGSIPSAEPLGTDGRLAFYGPLVGAVAFVAGSASAYLGLGIDGFVVGTSFLIITAAMVFGDRLPVIDAGLRRALVIPFIAVCGGVFNGFAGGDPRRLRRRPAHHLADRRRDRFRALHHRHARRRPRRLLRVARRRAPHARRSRGPSPAAASSGRCGSCSTSSARCSGSAGWRSPRDD